MSIEQIRNNLGDHLKDIKLNLSTVLAEEGAPHLTQKQIYLIGLACAYATKNAELILAIMADSAAILSAEECKAVKTAAAIMGMNNIYYRFTHLVKDKNFATMPAKLRMNAMAKPGIDKIDFELACLAVSAMNGCGMCLDAHVAELQKVNVSRDSIQSAVRIAAVLNATAIAMI